MPGKEIENPKRVKRCVLLTEAVDRVLVAERNRRPTHPSITSLINEAVWKCYGTEENRREKVR